MFSQYETLELGSSPVEESCSQVGTDDYMTRARKECRAYVGQLTRQFPVPADCDIEFGVKRFPHDFGSYLEVAVRFNTECDRSVEYALSVENNLPGVWDNEAKQELRR